MENLILELSRAVLRSEGRYEIEAGSDYIRIVSHDPTIKVTVEGGVLLSLNPTDKPADSVGKGAAADQEPAGKPKSSRGGSKKQRKAQPAKKDGGVDASRIIEQLKPEKSISNRLRGPKLTREMVDDLRGRFSKMKGSEAERIRQLAEELKRKKINITVSGVRKLIKKETWKD